MTRLVVGPGVRTRLLAVDPGIARPGLAVFEDGTLIIADTVKPPTDGDIVERAFSAASMIVACAYATTHPIRELVVEWPQAYDARKGKSKPGANQAIIPLAGVCVGVAMLIPGARKRSFLPSQWKGQIPKRSTDGKNIVKSRVLARLTDDERSIVPKRLSHDGYDAIGIGLHALGRWSGNVYPGATP